MALASGRLRVCSALASLIVALTALFVGDPARSFDSGPAYDLLHERVRAAGSSFFIYLDADSGFNHGFPSGFFGSSTSVVENKIEIDAACIDDPLSETGCSTDSTVLDRSRGSVLRIAFAPLEKGEFAGVNIEEPENWGVLGTGVGYDLRGGTELVFEARSPNGTSFQFSFGDRAMSAFTAVPTTWKTFSFDLSAFNAPQPLSDTHILFGVITDDDNADAGATILLDNIRIEPIPIARQDALGFPLGNETFGALPRSDEAPGRVPLPSDQVIRNLTTIYESSLVVIALLDRGSEDDLAAALLVLDAFVYALANENQGLPIPVSQDQSAGLHSGYSSGDLAFRNNQVQGAQAGQVKLSGFTAGQSLCGPTGFCVVLDGATGGNNAFVILALLHGFESFGDLRYLDAAREIARWIFQNLFDDGKEGFGGYFLGYPDEGVPAPKPLLTGKSIENVADIYAAFFRLARVEYSQGNLDSGALWVERANAAGDFVIELFDENTGCFFSGTVPFDLDAGSGIDPSGERRSDEVINVFRFVDANTFTTLALAETPRYRQMIDWRRPAQCALDRFSRSVMADGREFSGFGIDQSTAEGPDGVAWEFTAQIPVLLRLVDRIYGESTFEDQVVSILEALGVAQLHAPFTDGRGLVASTLEDGSSLAPIDQCLTTPFQCIPERVGLAATAWGIAAERDINYLPEPHAFWMHAAAVFAVTLLQGARNRFKSTHR